MRDLDKWPRLLVRGEPISHVLANEVLLRTNAWHHYTNDRAWLRQVAELADVRVTDHGSLNWNDVQGLERELGVLDLEYLANARIWSAWIGGPKGWLDWDGNVGCSTWNVGKWPSVETLTSEWTLIAEAFPFLSLRAQVVPGVDASEDENEVFTPAVEWTLADGRVVVNEDPTGLLREVEEPSFLACCVLGGERGVNPVRLDVALRQVRASALARRHGTP